MTVWNTYQGIEVKDVDPKVRVRHAKWGYQQDRMGYLTGASLLALEDGIFLVVCDADGCGFNGLTGRKPYVKPEGDYKSIIKQADSLLSHINGMHHPNKPNRHASLYTDDQIKVAIKIWLKWKGAAIKNWSQSACDELERRGFKPYSCDRWSPGQLGSLVREHMKKAQFKNIKAGPMDEDDQAVLADMIREAAAREGRGGTNLADNVRITTRRTSHSHIPVDYAPIIAASEAAKVARQEEESDVSTGASSDLTPNPILSFVGSGGVVSEPSPTKTLAMDPISFAVPAPRTDPDVVVHQPAPVTDFRLLVELEDGTPVFEYKGFVMAGKKVKGVQI